MLYQNLAGVAVNVIGNLILIPRIGAYASAGLTLLTEVIVCGGSLFTLARKFPVGAGLRVGARPLVATALAGATGLALAGLPWAGIPASLLVLAVTIRLLRCWPPEFTLPTLRTRK
jgi:O-antigen/teichoic acid export membrane protein